MSSSDSGFGFLGGSISISSANGQVSSNKRKCDDADLNNDDESDAKRRKSEDCEKSPDGFESKLNSAISVTLKSNSAVSLSSSSENAKESDSETERIMSMLGGTINIKKLSTDRSETEGDKDPSGLEDEDVADSLSKISKEISIQSVRTDQASTKESSNKIFDPIAGLSASISINKAISTASLPSTPNLPPGVTVSSVSVIKNSGNNNSELEQHPTRRDLKSSDSHENQQAKKLVENSQKISKEMSSLLHISKEVDVKPVLDEKGDIVASSSSDTARLPSSVDTSKLTVSVSITPIGTSNSSDRSKSTATAAPSRPNSSTSAPSRPSSGTSARSSSASPANSSNSISISGLGQISVKNSSILQENSSVPPPPPLSQQKTNFNSPSMPKLPQLPNQAPRLVGVQNSTTKLQHLLRGPMMGGVNQMLPPEAGPLSSQLHQASHKLAEMMRASIEEILAGQYFLELNFKFLIKFPFNLLYI